MGKPFIKWAGGKSQLLSDIRNKYPDKIERYCEPFLGGGAVMFDIIKLFQPKEILANDINKELINTYKHIQTNCDVIIKELKTLQNHFWLGSEEKRREIYLLLRNKFNEMIIGRKEAENLEKAVLFIFLNKTCFNGLYRVNSKGLFNVPIGSYKKPPICDEENLINCSKLLKNVKFSCADYSTTNDFIDSKTFVYIDPPYRPLSATSSFTAYSEFSFSDQEQQKLGKFIDSITQKGAKIILSNSDPKNTNVEDNFFDELYANYTINRIEAKRMINSNSSGRGSIKELLICNF
ncbi:MAG: DNA adenine methylase [Pusillimonas sp.]